jgi:hypothetical protein
VASLYGDNLVVFYYFHEIWPDQRGGLWWNIPYNRGRLSLGEQFSSILLFQ